MPRIIAGTSSLIILFNYQSRLVSYISFPFYVIKSDLELNPAFFLL